MKTVKIFGSTGSIGTQALNIIRRYKDKFKIIGLSANKNVELLKKQIDEFMPEFVYISDKKNAEILSRQYKIPVFYGDEGIKEFCFYKNSDISLIAISGISGILPTYLAIETSKRIALANKESLVSAGKFIMEKAKKLKKEIIPVDSEHSAIFQCINQNQKKFIKRVILTASGGPFWNKDTDFSKITVNEALKHPVWKMGKKISIDSATLMNKGLEVIEAKWLFDLPLEKISVLIHPQSIIHSMVEYTDGSIISQMGVPSMEIPISYALFYPERANLDKKLEFSNLTLNFFKPDFDKFPTIKFAFKALELGKGYPAGLNMANEVAVNLFLNGKIKFNEIFLIIEKIFSFDFLKNYNSIEDVFKINKLVKERLIWFI